jgi:hypothetical protein
MKIHAVHFIEDLNSTNGTYVNDNESSVFSCTTPTSSLSDDTASFFVTPVWRGSCPPQ